MSVLDGHPAAADTSEQTPETLRVVGDRDVPVLVDGTELFGAQPGSGYKTPPLLVRRADGQVVQLTPLLYAVLAAVDGSRDVTAVARSAGESLGRELHPEDVRVLLDTRLRESGLVLRPDGTHPPLRKSPPLLALRAKFVVSKPEVTRRVTAPFALLFNPAVVAVTTVAFAVICYWVLFRKGLASAAYEAFQRPGLLLAVFAVTVVSAGFHEFGHAAALRRGGGTPGAMGAGLYLIYPAFYTDVTDAYRLGRAARIRTDLGGLYFNALVAVAMFGFYALTRWDGVLLVIAAQVLQMVRQLPPLVRFDGYHLLADITGVPDLFHRISPTLRSFLPRRWRKPESRELKLWARIVVTVWTVLVVPLLVLTIALSVIALPRILGTTWHSVGVQAGQLSELAGTGDYAGVAVKVLAILALVVPVGGILYLIARMVRRYVGQTWRRTRGKPRQRAVACLAMLAIVAALAYEWWPRQGTYQPIQPGERGTVQDALPVAHTVSSGSVVPTVALRDGELKTTTALWPQGAPVPTKADPALAVVAAPRTGEGVTWVFPFNRPDPPGIGDNQALAIATHDGQVAYDVAFALVWDNGGGAATNTNSAYALASCKKCTAVAIAFQVVLVVGGTDGAAPTNVAVATSYKCPKCTTVAIAVQLMLTVPDGLTPTQLAELKRLWRRIMRWSHHLQGLTLAEIKRKLTTFEGKIIAVVDPAAVQSATASASPTPSGSASAVVPATTAGTSTGASATTAPSDTTTASAQPSASTSDSTSASPTDAPSTSPTPTPSSASSP
jgi:putative peptide zinc metalloprotease protein